MKALRISIKVVFDGGFTLKKVIPIDHKKTALSDVENMLSDVNDVISGNINLKKLQEKVLKKTK